MLTMPTFIRRIATVSAGLLLAALGTVVAASPASASSTYLQACGFYPQWTRYYCTHVTAIDPGSVLQLHAAPDYAHGVVHTPRASADTAVNGDYAYLQCWTTGAGDIDGHGDHYWFRANFWDTLNYPADNAPLSLSSGYWGYVNDWYVTTGAASYWMNYTYQGRKMPHC